MSEKTQSGEAMSKTREKDDLETKKDSKPPKSKIKKPNFFTRLYKYFFSMEDIKVDKEMREQQKKIMARSLEEKENPYLTGYATYIGLYADQEEKSAYHKRVNRFLLMIIIIMVCSFIVMAGNSKVQPYVVGINENGQVFDMNETVKNVADSKLRPKLAKFYVQQFVKSTFSVSIDGNVLRSDQAKSVAMVKGSGLTELSRFYEKRNIDVLASKYSISVSIHFVLPISPNTSRVSWTETKRDIKSGSVIDSTKYVGEFTYGWDVHATEKLIQTYNPLGFYVYNFTYSKDS